MAVAATRESEFPSAVLRLVSASMDFCQAKLLEKLAEHERNMLWFEEIVEETSKKMAEKSTTLEEMPKTPSVTKQRAQRRGRRKKTSTRLREINEENNTPTLPKTKTKLTFNVDSPEEQQSTAMGRGLRTRRQKVKYTDSDEETKLAGKRNSRKPVEKKTAKIETSDNSEDVDTQSDNEEGSQLSVAPKQPKVACSRDNQSPSVKDRATAYEAMIKVRVSKSPVKCATPKSPADALAGVTGKIPTSASVKSTPLSGLTPTSGSVVNAITVESQGKVKRLSSRRSLRKSARHSSVRKSGKKKSVELPRANRTRLRLKKVQKEDTETTDNDESAETNKTPQQKPTLPPKPFVTNPSAEVQQESDTETTTTQEVDPQAEKSLNETEILVTEVYELQPGHTMELQTYEMQQTKIIPVVPSVQLTESPVITCTNSRPCLSSDQGFNDGDDEEEEEEETSTKKVRSTRTRARAMAQLKEMESLNPSGSSSDTTDNESNLTAHKLNATFTREEQNQEESSPVSRSSRTRARIQQEAAAEEAVEKSMRSTRTRQRKADMSQKEIEAATDSTFNKDHEESSLQQQSTRTRTRQQQKEIAAPAPQEQPVVRSTRTRQRAKQEEQTKSEVAQEQKSVPMLLSDDEVVAGSPIPGTPKATLHGKKRLMEERGSSPRPKRSRSCIGNSIVQHVDPPLSSSSPVKRGPQEDDDVDLVLSPCKFKKTPPRAYQFTNGQKKVNRFLNRTPGFSQNSSHLYSFLSNSSTIGTPSMRQNVLTSFLKRHTPPPKQTIQAMQEKKKQMLLEKERKDKERLKKAAELRKKKVEQQKIQREEKARKVAEAKEQRLQQEQEQKDRLNKKLQLNAALKEKIMEERSKEEKEKQKIRLKKQMEADSRRKQEEEERRNRQLEQEEEARQQEKFMQRKREYEESERRRQIAEEKRRQEERLAEMEQKRQEDIARLKRQEEEKQQERERLRLEREKMFALERAERERIERQKRDLKEKRLAEEMEKLRVLEKERQERVAQEKLQMLKSQEELQKMIKQHNQKMSNHTATSTAAASIAAPAKSHSSYDLTPVKKKVLVVSNNPHDYGLDDKNSDDSTDDEAAPKKKIPEWAMGTLLNIALIRQITQPPDLDKIFRFEHIEAPNLELLFPDTKRRRFKQRTSSAVWTSPIVKH